MRWYQAFVRLIGGRLPARGRHLDAGCGHGAIVHLLSARGLDSYGIDASAYIVEQARAFAPDLAERLAVARLDEPLPFPGGFELVTCLEVLEHVPDPKAGLFRLAEHLAPGGLLAATTPNPTSPFPFYDPAGSDPTHISLHEPSWWRTAVRAAGLAPVAVSTYWPVPLLWRSSATLARWIRIPRGLGPGTLILARAVRPGGHARTRSPSYPS